MSFAGAFAHSKLSALTLLILILLASPSCTLTLPCLLRLFLGSFSGSAEDGEKEQDRKQGHCVPILFGMRSALPVE